MDGLLGLIYVADQSRTICDRDESAAPGTTVCIKERGDTDTVHKPGRQLNVFAPME